MPTHRAHPSPAAARRADVARALAMAQGGAVAFAVGEYALTLRAYSEPLSLVGRLRLAALTATLSIFLGILLAVATSAAALAARWAAGLGDLEARRRPGWFAPRPASGGVRPGVPVLWATAVCAALGVAGLQRAAAWAITHFKEPQLTAALIAGAALGLAAVLRVLYPAVRAGARLTAALLAPHLGVASPLGRWRAAGVALAGLVGAGLAVAWFAAPQTRSALPVRFVLAGLTTALGMGLGAGRHAARAARGGRGPAPRGRALAVAALGAGLVTATLVAWGADVGTRYVAITASPPLERLVALVRVANDLDRDGFGSLLGENDCAPLAAAIHPGARDLPDDGIDQNCDGHDFSLRAPPAPTGPTLPVPPAFKKDWNVLLITIDTLRYDHTTFGGYKAGPKRRDTTPRLAELVGRSTSFTFANAPSAGTMASIPAILTSRFFHSGVALDTAGVAPGMPPRLRKENTTLPEIMKRKGYATAVVASHEYWNDWGLDQGVDSYDNTIGKAADPYRVVADKVTDHALAWISRQQAGRWFLWAHYIDPHGYYVAHPDVVDYGATEEDKYDAEIRWTDQQVGRLLDELVRLPSNERTIVVITSDHGDSMGEHTVPLGTHGTALYRELQHVPLIFYVPDNRPQQLGGAVSNLDIVPTIAELCGIDVSDLKLEGKSLVPQLFYGRTDPARIVFAETNAPTPQRAAISERHKLIYYLYSNLYEFYDLAADPWEHQNLAPRSPPEMAPMKDALDAWLERVLYDRDPVFNQASARMADVILPAAPTPAVRVEGQRLDEGRLEIVGLDYAAGAAAARPGAKVDVHVYFEVRERPRTALRFLLAAWPVDRAGFAAGGEAPAATMLRIGPRATLDGLFPATEWHAGDHIRERFTLTIPADWRGDALALGLVASGPTGTKDRPTGVTASNDPTLAILGVLPLAPAPAAAAPAPLVPVPVPVPVPGAGSAAIPPLTGRPAVAPSPGQAPVPARVPSLVPALVPSLVPAPARGGSPPRPAP